MRICAVVGVLLVLSAKISLLASGGDARGDAVENGLEALKGTWVIVLVEWDGKTITDKSVTLTYDGAGRTVVKKDRQLLFDGTVKIDPTRKPKTLDVTQESEGESKGKTFPGIYELDGDTLKIYSAGPGKDRPTEFSSRPGSGYFLRVYRREKK